MRNKVVQHSLERRVVAAREGFDVVLSNCFNQELSDRLFSHFLEIVFVDTLKSKISISHFSAQGTRSDLDERSIEFAHKVCKMIHNRDRADVVRKDRCECIERRISLVDAERQARAHTHTHTRTRAQKSELT